MEKLLQAFSEGRLCACEEIEDRGTAHQNLCEKSFRLQGELEEKLNEEERELLESLIDSILDQCNCDAQNRFIRGYRLGVLMTTEVFMGQDDLLTE